MRRHKNITKVDLLAWIEICSDCILHVMTRVGLLYVAQHVSWDRCKFLLKTTAVAQVQNTLSTQNIWNHLVFIHIPVNISKTEVQRMTLERAVNQHRWSGFVQGCLLIQWKIRWGIVHHHYRLVVSRRQQFTWWLVDLWKKKRLNIDQQKQLLVSHEILILQALQRGYHLGLSKRYKSW